MNFFQSADDPAEAKGLEKNSSPVSVFKKLPNASKGQSAWKEGICENLSKKPWITASAIRYPRIPPSST